MGTVSLLCKALELLSSLGRFVGCTGLPPLHLCLASPDVLALSPWCAPRRQHYLAYKALYPSLKACFHSLAQQPGAAAAVAAAGSSKAEAWPHAGPIVSPSILSADFATLAADVNRVVAAGGWAGSFSWAH
jgi:hypothetical protein